MTEKEKYDGMYNTDKTYGKKNNGKDILDYVRTIADSVCDVGCGDGAFCRGLLGHVKYLYGVDLASSPHGAGIWWSSCSAENIMLPDSAVDCVTSFDVLEHLPTVDSTLDEFVRVAKKEIVLSISYEESSKFYKGETLHLTVKPEQWWIDKLSNYGTVTKYGKYLLVDIC